MSNNAQYRSRLSKCQDSRCTASRPRPHDSSPDSPRKKGKPSKPWSYTQLHLDFGQKDFSSKLCKECGMRFVPGCQEDERIHRRFHRSQVHQVIPFKPSRADIQVYSNTDGHQIVQLNIPKDTMKSKKIILNLCRAMEEDFSTTVSDLLHEKQKIYLYVKGSSAIGSLIAESVDKAFRMSKDKTVAMDMSIKEKAECGVVIIWVARKYRRLSIASTLLNVVRRNFVFGYSIPKARLAFRQPTDLGIKFANTYTNGHLLIY